LQLRRGLTSGARDGSLARALMEAFGAETSPATEAEGEHREGDAFPAVGQPSEKMWKYTPVNGRLIPTRVSPEIEAPRTAHRMHPGEVFTVVEERPGADGVTFLKLANDRGWLFDSKPGVGVMCVREAPGPSADAGEGPVAVAPVADPKAPHLDVDEAAPEPPPAHAPEDAPRSPPSCPRSEASRAQLRERLTEAVNSNTLSPAVAAATGCDDVGGQAAEATLAAPAGEAAPQAPSDSAPVAAATPTRSASAEVGGEVSGSAGNSPQIRALKGQLAEVLERAHLTGELRGAICRAKSIRQAPEAAPATGGYPLASPPPAASGPAVAPEGEEEEQELEQLHQTLTGISDMSAQLRGQVQGLATQIEALSRQSEQLQGIINADRLPDEALPASSSEHPSPPPGTSGPPE